MNVCVAAPSHLSKAMFRVTDALKAYAPDGVHIVPDATQADINVLHVIGHDAVEHAKQSGKPYGVLQYCLKTTQQPNTRYWVDFWARAKCVYSYYNIMQSMIDDGVQNPQLGIRGFVYGPLGVDGTIFVPRLLPRKITVMSSGYVASSECLHEVSEAIRATSGQQYHLGPSSAFHPTMWGDHIDANMGVTDVELAHAMSVCKYVVGLRRVEGFELPAAEGLLCGARPILFDAWHYRKWFGDFAEYIQEGTYEEVRDQLIKVFSGPYRAVSHEEIVAAREVFSWSKFASAVWGQLLQ